MFCDEEGLKTNPIVKKLNDSLKGALKRAFHSGEFEGKLNQSVVLHSVAGIAAARIVLAGIGSLNKLTDDSYRQAAGTVSNLPAVKNSRSAAFFFGDGESAGRASAVVEGFLLGHFEMNDYKSKSDDKSDKLDSVYFVAKNKAWSHQIKDAIVRGQIVADGVILARRLAAHPGNFLPPRKFAEQAKSLARRHRLGFKALNETQMRAEKMGALLAVAQGSHEAPRFVILEYRGTKKFLDPIVLIGKGITFDSGGISLKPGLDMWEMKGDMQGGAIVLAALVTSARLNLPLNIVGLIPLAENMPSSKALKPGDIVKSRKGKTIEIISTDAEGRLILADALDYANEFKPQAVVDIATLTGAALYVLGYAGAPILGNNGKLMDGIRAASEATAEKVWEMPLWDEYREQMKSSIADLKNSGGKPAGTIAAAAFLENFVGDWPWAHIDIAYVDLEKGGRPYTPKGASGFGLRLLVELLSGWRKLQK